MKTGKKETKGGQQKGHSGHDVRTFDGGWETRCWCRTCSVGWSDVNLDTYSREVADEQGNKPA